MGIEITRVGKKWFHCISSELKIMVEASYSNRTKFVINPKDTETAGYNVWDHIRYISWNLTGTGANKYRNEIISALEESMTRE